MTNRLLRSLASGVTPAVAAAGPVSASSSRRRERFAHLVREAVAGRLNSGAALTFAADVPALEEDEREAVAAALDAAEAAGLRAIAVIAHGVVLRAEAAGRRVGRAEADGAGGGLVKGVEAVLVLPSRAQEGSSEQRLAPAAWAGAAAGTRCAERAGIVRWGTANGSLARLLSDSVRPPGG